MQSSPKCIYLNDIHIPNEIFSKISDDLDNYDILVAEWVCADWRRLLSHHKKQIPLDIANNLLIFKPEIAEWAFNNGCNKIFGIKLKTAHSLKIDSFSILKRFYDDKFVKPPSRVNSEYFESRLYKVNIMDLIGELFDLTEFRLIKKIMELCEKDDNSVLIHREQSIYKNVFRSLITRAGEDGKIKLINWLAYQNKEHGSSTLDKSLIYDSFTLACEIRDRANRQKIAKLEKQVELLIVELTALNQFVCVTRTL
jgi:hypothetical protein